MSFSRLLLVVGVLLPIARTALAETITSTAVGGSWFDGTTWIGGIVPGPADDVVIIGPVTIAGIAPCRSLEVDTSGSIHGEIVSPPRTLRVSGAIANRGSVGAANPIYLDVEVGGDLHNAGTWAPVRTRWIGNQTRHLSQEPGSMMTTDLAYASGASGDVVATTPITLSGFVDMAAGLLVLQPGCPLTLDAAAFLGNMAADGNEIRFASWSYLGECAIDHVVLVGEAQASFGVSVSTRLTVTGSLRNVRNHGGGSVTVEGDLVNHGLIENDQYSFPLRVTGDIENNGIIRCPTLELPGAGAVHHIRMDFDGVIHSPVILPEFQEATIIAETPVRFGDGLGLGAGTLVLAQGASLELVAHGGLGSGTVLAGGNIIRLQGSGGIGGVTIDQGVLEGQILVQGESRFTGGLLVSGAVEGRGWSPADLTVEGTLHNNGAIGDGEQTVRIRALGDLINQGTFANSRVVLAGTTDQAVGAGPMGLAVPEFIIESGLQATGYQWYRDGEPLEGETGADLVLSMVGSDDYGVYHCEAGDRTSRNIIIAENAGPTSLAGPPWAPGSAGLRIQVQPNPFHAETQIAFDLGERAKVSLSVYDISGRQVANLASDREMGAGRHEIGWSAGKLPAGNYVIRLSRGGAVVSQRKGVLLK